MYTEIFTEIYTGIKEHTHIHTQMLITNLNKMVKHIIILAIRFVHVYYKFLFSN